MDVAAATLDPRTYRERIRYDFGARSAAPSAPTLRALHEAHLLAVPFENLSIHYGQPITLGDAALYDKIVRRRRGGFCYELNGLFAWLLREMGFMVDLLSARVAEPGGGFSPEFDHMTLRVRQVDGADYLADVGFGDSFRLPLRMQPGDEQDGGDGCAYRLTHDASDGAWMLWQRRVGDWEPQYRFTPQPHVMADFAERCHFQQTSPESHFTRNRLCTLALPDGRLTLSDLRLITTMRGEREEREMASEEEYRAVLARRFGVTLP